MISRRIEDTRAAIPLRYAETNPEVPAPARMAQLRPARSAAAPVRRQAENGGGVSIRSWPALLTIPG